MAILTTARTGNTATAATLFAPVANAVAALRGWNDTRQTRRALSQLTARELDDIGLVPGDIDAVARGAFRR